MTDLSIKIEEKLRNRWTDNNTFTLSLAILKKNLITSVATVWLQVTSKFSGNGMYISSVIIAFIVKFRYISIDVPVKN